MAQQLPKLYVRNGYWTAQSHGDNGKRRTWTFGHVGKVTETQAKTALRRKLRLGPTEAASSSLALEDVIQSYIDWCRTYYRYEDGTHTTYIDTITFALQPLVPIYGRLPADDFRPRHLRIFVESQIAAKLARSLINKRIAIIKKFFRWAKDRELIRPSVVGDEILPVYAYDAIRDFIPLSRGRTAAKEPKPIHAVPQDIVEATLPHLPATVQTMVRVQQLAGCRPEEVCRMRAVEIDVTRKPWLFEPRQHKTAHKGKARRIWLGPQARALIEERMRGRPLDAYLFTRDEAAAEMQGKPAPVVTAATPRFRTNLYRQAIWRACARAFPMPDDLRKPLRKFQYRLREGKEISDDLRRQAQQAKDWNTARKWSPNQLRHLGLSEIRRAEELAAAAKAAAQAVAGHSDVRTTEIYLTPADLVAQSVMERVG